MPKGRMFEKDLRPEIHRIHEELQLKHDVESEMLYAEFEMKRQEMAENKSPEYLRGLEDGITIVFNYQARDAELDLELHNIYRFSLKNIGMET